MVEVRAPGQDRRGGLAGVNQVLVLAAGRGLRAEAENAVLAMQDDFPVLGDVVGDQRGQADAEIDIGAVGNIARDARGDLVAIELFHAAFLIRSRRITRCTKIPGVTTVSGSSSPSSTVSRTCATVHFAAAAMIGPKLRAVLR